jgi:hypothetical protein
VGLEPNKDTTTQLKALNASFLGCRVGSVWKVNIAYQKIKQLQAYADLIQTPTRVFEPKRGHRIPDYLLIISDKAPIYSTLARSNTGTLGLVETTSFSEEDGMCTKLHLIQKQSFEDFVAEEEKRLKKKANIKIEEKENFLADWNDFIQLIFADD